MFYKSDFAEWRDMAITQALYTEINELTTEMITEIINRRQSNVDRDQYLRGFIAALSEVAGFVPELIQEEDDGKETQTVRVESSSQAE